MLSYLFNVKPDTIFAAWTEPEIMKQWLFKSSNNDIISIHKELRIGGRFSILELNNDEKIDHFGKYLKISKPNKLDFTLEVPWHFDGVSKVSIQINGRENSCEMIFKQSGIKTNKTKDNWKKMFENLKIILKQQNL